MVVCWIKWISVLSKCLRTIVCIWFDSHYDDIIMGAMASQITSLTIVFSTVYSGADQSKHQSSASLAFVWGIHREPVNSPNTWPVTRKMFPFDDVIMCKALYFLSRDRCYFGTTYTSMGMVIRERNMLVVRFWPAQNGVRLERIHRCLNMGPSQYKDGLSRYGISIIKIRRSRPSYL